MSGSSGKVYLTQNHGFIGDPQKQAILGCVRNFDILKFWLKWIPSIPSGLGPLSGLTATLVPRFACLSHAGLSVRPQPLQYMDLMTNPLVLSPFLNDGTLCTALLLSLSLLAQSRQNVFGRQRRIRSCRNLYRSSLWHDFIGAKLVRTAQKQFAKLFEGFNTTGTVRWSIYNGHVLSSLGNTWNGMGLTAELVKFPGRMASGSMPLVRLLQSPDLRKPPMMLWAVMAAWYAWVRRSHIVTMSFLAEAGRDGTNTK